MRRFLIGCLSGCLVLSFGASAAETPPVLDARVAVALAQELSGDTAKRNLQVISQSHRMRSSQGYRAAAEHVAAQLRAYGMEDVEILQFPADGKTMFGTQRSRPSWDVRSAELWELAPGGAGWSRATRIADWNSAPLVLAQDSESANVTADLIDVGAGTSAADYSGKDVRGKLVLVASQPEAVQALAIDRYGAAGIVSYAQNQRTAWWGEDASLLRWVISTPLLPRPRSRSWCGPRRPANGRPDSRRARP